LRNNNSDSSNSPSTMSSCGVASGFVAVGAPVVSRSHSKPWACRRNNTRWSGGAGFGSHAFSSAVRKQSPRSWVHCCGEGAKKSGGDESFESIRSSLEHVFENVELANCCGSACLWCAGSGKNTCAWCGGKGHRMEMEMKSSEAFKEDIDAMIRGEPVPLPGKVPVRCSACHGSKLLACRYCRGSGSGSYGFSSARSP